MSFNRSCHQGELCVGCSPFQRRPSRYFLTHVLNSQQMSLCSSKVVTTEHNTRSTKNIRFFTQTVSRSLQKHDNHYQQAHSADRRTSDNAAESPSNVFRQTFKYGILTLSGPDSTPQRFCDRAHSEAGLWQTRELNVYCGFHKASWDRRRPARLTSGRAQCKILRGHRVSWLATVAWFALCKNGQHRINNEKTAWPRSQRSSC